jgi:hypothetical protein
MYSTYAMRRSPRFHGFPYLGQAPADRLGPTRKLAALKAGYVRGHDLSMKVRDPGKVYPGRMVFTDADPALYVVSARPAPEGTVYLYVIEGPELGRWKSVPVSQFMNYRLVDEDYGIVLRNLPGVHFPRGVNPDDLDVSSITLLLSGAIIAVSESFPVPTAMNPASAAKYYEDGRDGAFLAMGLVLKGLDNAGSSYDALLIGKNAYNLIRAVGTEMLKILGKISDALSRYARDGYSALKEAVSLADDFMSRVPLWSLYLERASLWTQVTDIIEMTKFREDARAIEAMAQRVLDAIEKNPETLKKNGLTDEDLAHAKSYATALVRSGLERDAKMEQGLRKYLDRAEISEDELWLLRSLFARFLEYNAESIRKEIGGAVKFNGGTALGFLFLGTLSQQGPPRPVSYERTVRLLNELKGAVGSFVSRHRHLKPADIAQLISPHLERLHRVMAEDMSRVAEEYKKLEAAGKPPANVREAIQAEFKRIENEYKKNPNDESIKKRLDELGELYNIVHIEQLFTDRSHLDRFHKVNGEILSLFSELKAANTPDKVSTLAFEVFSRLLDPETRNFTVVIEYRREARRLIESVRGISTLLRLDRRQIGDLFEVLTGAIMVSGARSPGKEAIPGEFESRYTLLFGLSELNDHVKEVLEGEWVTDPRHAVEERHKALYELHYALEEKMREIEQGSAKIAKVAEEAKATGTVTDVQINEMKAAVEQKVATVEKIKETAAKDAAQAKTQAEASAAREVEQAAAEEVKAAAELEEKLKKAEAAVDEGIEFLDLSESIDRYRNAERKTDAARFKNVFVKIGAKILALLKRLKITRPKVDENLGRERAHGAKLAAEAKENDLTPGYRSFRKIAKWLGLGIGALGAAGLGAYFYFSGADPKGADPIPPEPPKPPESELEKYLKYGAIAALGAGFIFYLILKKKSVPPAKTSVPIAKRGIPLRK